MSVGPRLGDSSEQMNFLTVAERLTLRPKAGSMQFY
ncbi:hypothetical protein CBM2589_A20039 [Cupriavidus taiwanensis]|uniref:Uncharacterized protein n=1 Tax=Cupriavidus taiwanensis TaxID=164546 RepID=A0A375BZX1_9BURK|nr:hypothetical protein CBM2589_A20039 [Cupriavidus taiwanensis]